MPMTGSVVKRENACEEFEWKIQNFTLAEGPYWTPDCNFRNENWQFAMYPNLIDEYIGLSLWRQSPNSLMNLEFSVALKTSDGQKSFERGGTELFDERKCGCVYRWISRSEFERRESEFLSSGSLTVMIALKRVDFVELARRRHFFRSKYIPMNKNSSASISHESLNMSTTSDAVQNENASQDFEWKIDNFLLTVNSYISSQFKFQNDTWQFVMFPNMRDGYIGLGVWRITSGSPLLVEFSVALKTSNGQKNFERGWTDIFGEWKYSCEYRWMRRSEFERRESEFLSSGCLKIIITLKIVDAVQPATSTITAVGNHSKFFQDLKQLLLNQENSDVVLRVKGEEFPAHRAILAVRSPVFASTFRNDMKEKKTGIVDITDCEPSVFPHFLCYLYSDDTDSLSGENVFDLFKIADKYECLDLRAKCLDFMKENVSVEAFCEALTIALQYGEAELLRMVTDFFIKNAKKILVTVSWQTFATENPIQSNELFIKFVEST